MLTHPSLLHNTKHPLYSFISTYIPPHILLTITILRPLNRPPRPPKKVLIHHEPRPPHPSLLFHLLHHHHPQHHHPRPTRPSHPHRPKYLENPRGRKGAGNRPRPGRLHACACGGGGRGGQRGWGRSLRGGVWCVMSVFID